MKGGYNIKIPTAIITYICPSCGWIEEDEHYLYRR